MEPTFPVDQNELSEPWNLKTQYLADFTPVCDSFDGYTSLLEKLMMDFRKIILRLSTSARKELHCHIN